MTTIEVTYNKKTLNINPDLIPQISPSTYSVYQGYMQARGGDVYANPGTSLKSRAIHLRDLQNERKLLQGKDLTIPEIDDSVIDGMDKRTFQLCCLLRSAATIALLAGVILGSVIFCPAPLGIGIAILGGILYFVVGLANAASDNLCLIKDDTGGAMFAVVGAPFFPIHEAICYPRQKKDQEEKIALIREDLARLETLSNDILLLEESVNKDYELNSTFFGQNVLNNIMGQEDLKYAIGFFKEIVL